LKLFRALPGFVSVVRDEFLEAARRTPTRPPTPAGRRPPSLDSLAETRPGFSGALPAPTFMAQPDELNQKLDFIAKGKLRLTVFSLAEENGYFNDAGAVSHQLEKKRRLE